MLDTSARLLRLLSLLQVRREWSGYELAEKLGISVRTVRRDIDRLRSLGYQVDAVSGTGGGYQLAVGTSLPPLLLDDEEAIAVVIGLRTAAVGTVTGIAETSLLALAKMDRLLPSRLRGRVEAIDSAIETMPMLGSTVASSALTAIASAVRNRERLRFDYTPGQGAVSLRDVEPYRMVHGGQRWYLFGWDTGRSGWRTFRIDRMFLRVPNGPRFHPRTLPDDIASHMSLGMTTTRFRYQAVVTMHGSAQEVADEVPSTIGLVEPLDDATCTLRIGSGSLGELAVWTAAFGFDFEVREPPELVAHLRTMTERLHRAVRSSEE